MAKTYWDKLSGWGKFLFCLGWLSAFNLVFWLVILIVYLVNSKEKYFWDSKGFIVVKIFGWINFFALIIGFIIAVLAVLFFLITVGM